MFENLVGVRAIRMVDNVRPSTTSMANCADGRIIAVFTQGNMNQIYHGYYNGYPDVVAGNMTPRAVTWQEMGYTANGRVFNVGSDLYLVIRRAPAVTDGTLKNFSTILYKSPSGNGGDWVVHGTVWSYDSDTNYYLWPADEAPGIPHINDDGRWVMTTSTQVVFLWFGVRRQDDGTSILYSDDEGVTWTLVTVNDAARIGSDAQPYIVEFQGSLLLVHRLGTSYRMKQGSLDGESWTDVLFGGGVDLAPGLMYATEDELYMSKLYISSSGYGLYKTTTIPTLRIPDNPPWEFVYSDNWERFGEGNQTIAYIGEEICILSTTGYIFKSGLSLQTMSRLVWVVPDPGGSMSFEGQRYRFVKTIAESEVTTHANAGLTATYTYAGPSLTVDNTLLVFLASGVTDHTAWGGYSDYTNATSRTVVAMADRENFVNFYYTPPQAPLVTTDEILNETLLKGFTTEFSITNIGTSPVTLCGFIFSSTVAEPELTSGQVIQYGPGAVGTFQATYLGKLNPDVTYYVRAFAMNSYGPGYGNVLELLIETTVPVITNIEITNATEDGFSIKFSIDDLGALSADVGFVFGKEAGPQIGDTGVTNLPIGTVVAPQNITFDYVGDIEVDVPYYLTGYGTNSAGTGYGTDLTFTLPEMFFWQFVGTPRHARLTHKDEDDHPQYAKESDLASVMNDYSGADMIGVTPITGVTGGTVQEVLESIKALIGAAETGLEASFEDVDPWVITHNLQRLIDLTIWERTADAVGFGVQEFGTSLFGGAEEIHTVASPGVVTVTQQGLNETILTWGTNKSGRVVYR